MGEVTGAIRWTLRVEGLLVLIAGLLVYSKQGFGWSTFALFFFLPDISFLGYLAGPRVGAVAYSVCHSYIGALICLVAGYLLSIPVLAVAGLIWCSHIGFDRALGYGLKYSAEFGFTHLGRIGRWAKAK